MTCGWKPSDLWHTQRTDALSSRVLNAQGNDSAGGMQPKLTDQNAVKSVRILPHEAVAMFSNQLTRQANILRIGFGTGGPPDVGYQFGRDLVQCLKQFPTTIATLQAIFLAIMTKRLERQCAGGASVHGSARRKDGISIAGARPQMSSS